MASKSFTVAVFNCRSMTRAGKPGKNRPNAYLRDYSPDWKACMHTVDAENGAKAKSLAIAQHLSPTWSCDQRDPHEVCGG